MICVNSVNVSPGSITLKKGSWYYGASATVCPTNADCTDVTWHSSNSSVASVNASSGYICANAVGTARIYATATDGSGCSDYITVTVTNTASVTSVTLNRIATSLEVGNSITLGATVCPENATNKTIEWSSSNTDIAIVNNGVVCGISAGTAAITASATDGSGKWVRCLVRVTNDILVKSINISAPKTLMIPGESMFVTATVLPTNATKKSVCWSSSNSAIITVNENTGLVMAQGIGIATIYATACDGSGTVESLAIDVGFSMYERHQENNPCYSAKTPIGTVKGIVVHSTGANNPNLKRYVDAPDVAGVNKNGNHWNKSNVQKMVHGFIGLDKNSDIAIINTLPYNLACWGVGKGSNGSYNYAPNGHIQFEICEDDLTDEEYYEKAVWGAAVQYCAYLCKQFNLSADKVIDHKEAHDAGYGSNHGDIHHWLSRYGDTMNDFRLAVQEQINLDIE